VHVQPPAEILEQMISVRLHLDPCPAINGALRGIPGSHRSDKLSAAEIEELTTRQAVICEAPLGSALLMRPLLLHASSPSTSPHHRRVIHLDYAAVELPCGLEWRETQTLSLQMDR